MKRKYDFIDYKDLVIGRLYGSRPDKNCPKYLYTGGLIRSFVQFKFADSGKIINPFLDENDGAYFIHWDRDYDIAFRHQCTLNEMMHDIFELSKKYRFSIYDRLNYENPESDSWYKINVNREIRMIFDPIDTYYEEFVTDWIPINIEKCKPCPAYPAGYKTAYDLSSEDFVPGFSRVMTNINPGV